MKTIIKENTSALEGVGGPIGFYFRQPLAKALLAFYRLHYNVDASQLVDQISKGRDYEAAAGEDITEIIIDFVTGLFPDISPLEVFTGEPQAGKSYLALVSLPGALGNTDTEYVDSDGNKVQESFRVTDPMKPLQVAGLYSVEQGFRFMGSPISSASLEDIVDYTLMHQAEVA